MNEGARGNLVMMIVAAYVALIAFWAGRGKP
jgi:hypothetical protein